MPVPGEYLLSAEPIEINAGRRTVKLTISNTGDRAVQVGSHFHFFEVNRALAFDRAAALGMRLNIPAGTAVRFEPGDTRAVELVEIGGMKRVVGFNRLVMGSVATKGTAEQALARAATLRFAGANGARIDEEGSHS
jgi:urease subunit beta